MAGSLDFRLNLLANTSGLEQGMNGAKFAVNALVAAMGAVGVGVSVKGIADAADSYANLSARINIATKDGGDFTSAMSGVHQVALMTNTSLDSTGMLFTKVNDIGKQMGLTQQDSLDLVKTINMAITTGGGSAAASEAAIVQLTQALQSGVLRGDEFNSIMEQAPGISSALAKSLGVTTGELRKMAGEGQLSSTTVIKALRDQSASIQADYDKFPLTIGRALQKIQTSWQILIGTMDQANGASATVAQWLAMLADNMGIVTTLLDDIGEGFVWVGDQLKKIDTATIEALKTALETTYGALKELGSTVGVAFEAVVDVINTALSTVFFFGSAVDEVGDKTNGFTKILQVINLALGVLSDGFSAIGITINLFVGALYSAASAFVSLMSTFTWGDVKESAIANMTAMQAKADEYYQKASDGAMNFKSKAVQAIEEVGKTQKEKYAEVAASSKDTLDKLLADQKTEVDGKKVSEDEKLKAAKAYAEAAIAANGGVMDGTIQADLITKGYIVTLDGAGKVVVSSMAEAKKAVEENSKATELAQEKAKQAETAYQEFIKSSAAEKIQLQKQIEQAKVSGDLTALNSAKTSLAAINAKEAELNEIRKQRNAEAISGAVGVSKAAESAAKVAAEAIGINIDISLNRVSKSFKETGGNVDTLSKNIAGLGITGTKASNLIYEGWVKWLEKAKSPAEIDFAKAKLDEFKEKGVFSTKQVELGMQAIQRATAKLPDDLDEVGAAFDRLGIKTKEQLKLAAQSALADFNTVQASGQATAEGIKQAYERAMQAAASSGDVAVIAATKSKAASLGLEVQVDSTGKATVKSGDEMEASMHRVRNATDGAKQGFRELGQTARDEALSSTEAWNKAMQAKAGSARETVKGEKTRLSFTKEEVAQQLMDMGYDEKQAKTKAKDIIESSKSGDGYKNASGTWLAKNGLDVIGSFANGGGGSSNANYIREQLEQYSQYAGKSSVQTGNAPTQKIEITNGKQTANLNGSKQDVNNMEAMLREFEMLKKGM